MNIIKEIEKRIVIADNNQHTAKQGSNDYTYWKGAAEALQALLDKIVEADG